MNEGSGERALDFALLLGGSGERDLDLRFERVDNNLVCNQTISVFDLITGSSFEFTTLSGKTLNVNVKPGTQPHSQLKLSGFGMPILNTPLYGDQIILLKPYIPDNIDSNLIDAINRFK